MTSDLASPGAAAPPVDEPGGRIITFYSYKGGVGRSMAVANVAWMMAERYGRKVTIIDWDLEAPGLHRYFGLSETDLGPGVIDYLIAYKAALRRPTPPVSPSDIAVSRYLQRVRSFPSGGEIRLMPAGAGQDRPEYGEHVRSFDWTDFYDNWNGAQLIEALRNELRKAAEITLIDSRTGITDVGGVCTVQLPDTVLFVFSFNEQNLGGIERIARDLSSRDNPTLKQLNRWPTILFLPSRKEMSEPAQQRKWEAEAAERLGRFCDSPRILKAYGDVQTYLRKIAVPYSPHFAYGEELAAKTELGLEIRDALDPTVAFLLERDHDSAAMLVEQSAGAARKIRGRVEIGIGIVLCVAFAFTALVYFTDALSYLSTPGDRGSFATPRAAALGVGGGITGASFSFLGGLDDLIGKDAFRFNIGRIWRYAGLQLAQGVLSGAAAAYLLRPEWLVILASFAASFILLPLALSIGESAAGKK